jgi:hypothetical protein
MSYIMADVEELYETGIDTGMKPTLPPWTEIIAGQVGHLAGIVYSFNKRLRSAHSHNCMRI